VAEDVVGLDVTMGKSQLVHRLQAVGCLDEGVDDVDQRRRQPLVQGLAVDQLHDEEGFVDLQQHGFVNLQVVRAAKVRVDELPGDLELRLHLLDKTDVLGVISDNVLKRK